MPDLLAQVTLKHLTGIVENDVVNTFAFSMPSGFGATEAAALRTCIQNFYDGTGGGATASIESRLSRSISRAANAHTVDIYDISGHLDGTPHGSPIHTLPFSLSNTGAGGEPPSEVALALTLRGTSWASQPVESPDGSDPGTAIDRPRQRHSGRIFLGPWNGTVIPAPGSPYVSRPSALMINDILLQAVDFAQDVKTVMTGARWCVWSRADEFLYTITDVQMDDAWDTMRSRGVDASVRSTMAVP